MVNRVRTGNTMVQRKRTARQTDNNLQHTMQKTKDRTLRAPLKRRGVLIIRITLFMDVK